LDSFDSTHVVFISSKLVVACTLRESRFGDEVTRLLVQTLLDETSDNNVYQSCLSDIVHVQA